MIASSMELTGDLKLFAVKSIATVSPKMLLKNMKILKAFTSKILPYKI